MGMLARIGLVLTRWTERWIPDSWVIAVMLSLCVAGLAMTVGGASPATALQAWGQGLWALLSLAMQFTLMMVLAYACAVSPPLKQAFAWMAGRPNPAPDGVFFNLYRLAQLGLQPGSDCRVSTLCRQSQPTG